MSFPSSIVVSGSNLFIANYNTNSIGEYTTSGATVNASLITGLSGPVGIAVSGSNLFVVNVIDGAIGEYDTSGATLNASLISGLNHPNGIALSGSDLFVAVGGAQVIGEYTTSGATINAALVSGLSNPVQIWVGNSETAQTIGGLDPTFGVNGLASNDVGFNATNGVVLQPNGQSVILGTVGSGSSPQSFGLTRYNVGGSLDTSFGAHGVVDSGFGGSDEASAAYVPATGDILVAGTDNTATGSQFAALAEYTSAGALDSGFGNGNGFVLTTFSTTLSTLSNDTAHALIVAPDGTIYVAGSSDAAGKGLDFAIASYNSDGSANTSFNGAAELLLDFSGGDDVANAIALQSNGDVVEVGSTENPSTGIDSIALARFLPTGAVDPHFGKKGQVTTSVRGVADVASSVAIDKIGKIIIGGLSATGSALDGSLSSDFVVARYTSSGVIDRTFGGGPVITPFNQPSAITQVLIQANGEIVASGKTVASLNGLDPTQLEVALARYTTSGKLDTSFNTTGTAIISLGGAAAAQAAEAAGAGSGNRELFRSSFDFSSGHREFSVVRFPAIRAEFAGSGGDYQRGRTAGRGQQWSKHRGSCDHRRRSGFGDGIDRQATGGGRGRRQGISEREDHREWDRSGARKRNDQTLCITRRCGGRGTDSVRQRARKGQLEAGPESCICSAIHAARHRWDV